MNMNQRGPAMMHTRVLFALAVIAVLFGASALPAKADPVPPTTYDPASTSQQYGADDASTCGAGQIGCADLSCVNDGNPNGYCWYSGYQFLHRTICLEVPASPMYWTYQTAVNTGQRIAQLWAVEGIRIYVRNTAAGCSQSGFAKGQIVGVQPYYADDGHCGYFTPSNYGYHNPTGTQTLRIMVNMHPDTATSFYASACRSGENWYGFIGHEFGHGLGLSHYAGGIMSVGVPMLSETDKAMVANLYGDNACGDPLWPACG